MILSVFLPPASLFSSSFTEMLPVFVGSYISLKHGAYFVSVFCVDQMSSYDVPYSTILRLFLVLLPYSAKRFFTTL